MVETEPSKRVADNAGEIRAPEVLRIFARARAVACDAPPLPGPSTWLNLICLDAPLVAASWLWLFARSLRFELDRASVGALFLTAWFIYLADRFGDSLALRTGMPMSLRQRFCLQHRGAWMVALAVIGFGDAILISTQIDSRTRWIGGAVGIGAVIYLVLNRQRPSLWRILPLKEISIGFLFAAGTMVPLVRGLTSKDVPAWFLFGCLCSLNCISIAIWERALDFAQDRVSIATSLPRVSTYLLSAMAVLCLTSLAAAVFLADGRDLYLAIGASTLTLALVHRFKERFQDDARTALADLVLLTPLLFW